MKRFTTHALLASLAAVLGVSANAATITNSASAPAVDGDDIANLAAATGGQSIWSDRPVQGQTFTSSATGGDLVSITVQINEGDGEILGWKDYQLRIGTIDTVNGLISPLVVTVDRYDPDAVADTYFTFTLDSPLALAPNTLYGFDIGINGSQEGWQAGIPSVRTTGDEYAGGQRFQGAKTGQIDDITGLPNNISLAGGDLVFHAEIVPEPGSLALIALGGTFMLRRRRRSAQ